MRIRRLIVVLGSIVGLILSAGPALAGQGEGTTTANGWYEGEEIYYILHGVEEGVTERGGNDLYLIGGDRGIRPTSQSSFPVSPATHPTGT